MRDGDGDSGGGNGDNVETNATHSRLLNGTTTQYLNFEFVSTIYVDNGYIIQSTWVRVYGLLLCSFVCLVYTRR